MSPTATAQQIEARIVDAIESFGPDGQVTPAATFEQLDLDSLDLVEMAQIVEDEFGVKLGSEDMKELVTVGDVIALVTARAS